MVRKSNKIIGNTIVEAAKKSVPRDCLLRLLPLLDPQKAYDGEKTLEAKENYQIQRTLLDIFYEMSKTSKSPLNHLTHSTRREPRVFGREEFVIDYAGILLAIKG